jgi:SEC-C motif-containing protein
MKNSNVCPCGSGQNYIDCCGRYHAGSLPETAEQLMRSRYSAFVRNDEAYLLASWHTHTRPKALGLSDQEPVKWVGLKVLSYISEDEKATVEFIARFKINGKAEKIHELSRFVKEQGRWFYVDGDNIA